MALPWIVFAIAITVAGGLIFAAAMIAIGAVCLNEYLGMTEDRGRCRFPPTGGGGADRRRPLRHRLQHPAGPRRLVPGAVRLRRPSRHTDGFTVSISVTLLGIFWIGIPLVHAVLLRDLPHHGAALLIDVLVGTFVTDTAAYACGRLFGSHKVAPTISPTRRSRAWSAGL